MGDDSACCTAAGSGENAEQSRHLYLPNTRKPQLTASVMLYHATPRQAGMQEPASVDGVRLCGAHLHGHDALELPHARAALALQQHIGGELVPVDGAVAGDAGNTRGDMTSTSSAGRVSVALVVRFALGSLRPCWFAVGYIYTPVCVDAHEQLAKCLRIAPVLRLQDACG